MNTLELWTSTIFEPADIVELRCIKQTAGKPIIKKFWHEAQNLPREYDRLRTLNRHGFNIHAGVNPRIAKGKSGDSNVKLARCLFCDFDDLETGDGCGPEEFISIDIFEAGLPEPSLYVNSGNGIHVYWRLDEPLIDLEKWSHTQKALNDRIGADPAIKNPERLMRIPGFWNLKHPKKESYIIHNHVQNN